MSIPELRPVSTSPTNILPATGTFANVIADAVPLGCYLGDDEFITGAVKQVSYTYKMLGGDVVDIELTDCNVYTAYETAVLKYSEIINTHQAKNVLSDFLGIETGTFDHKGDFKSGSFYSGSSNPSLQFPQFTFSMSRRVADGIASKAGIGGAKPIFSASFDVVPRQQVYDLQSIVSSSAASGTELYSTLVNANPDARIRIHRVYYRSPTNLWRFYGYYGGLSVVGNLSTYGQYSDDSTFEVVPVWQNKLQAMMFETNLYTRASHYTYEIKNNMLKIFPPPSELGGFSVFNKIFFEFSVDTGPLDVSGPNGDVANASLNGVNNFNTIPFPNLPYCNINSMGKQWIRDYALAISKSMLAQIRGKFQTIPIPGNDVTLNYGSLESQAKEEMEALITRLREDLDTMMYVELTKRDQEIADASEAVESKIPLKIYVG